MSEQIKERIRIIDSYKSYYNWEEKTQEQQLRYLKWSAIAEIVFAVVFLGFIVYISAASMFSEGHGDVRWGKAGLLVLLVVSISFRAPVSFIELMLKYHRNKIRDLDKYFEPGINADLQRIVSRINSKGKKYIIAGIPTLIVIISALLQTFEINPYWDALAYVVFFYGIFMLAGIFYCILAVRKNLVYFNKA